MMFIWNGQLINGEMLFIADVLQEWDILYSTRHDDEPCYVPLYMIGSSILTLRADGVLEAKWQAFRPKMPRAKPTPNPIYSKPLPLP